MIPLTELKVGMKVRAVETDGRIYYTGTVYHVSGDRATIKRDDNQTGGGVSIPKYGGGWSIRRKSNGTWDGEDGTLELVYDMIKNWREFLQ